MHHMLLISAQDGGEQSALCSRCFTPRAMTACAQATVCGTAL
jgi:hypothetical protein